MIGFDLTEEQQMIQETAHQYAEDRIRPVAAHHDETGEYPWEVIRGFWELGLLNVMIPESVGGAGLGCLDATIIAEETAWGCSGIGTAIEANGLAQGPVVLFGTPEQHEQFLRPMTEELQMAAYCVTEPGAGSDVQGISMTATEKGDVYLLNGNKMWITNASTATWYFVLAYTDKAAGYKGLTGFIVPADSPGIEVGRKEQNLGQRASDTRGITFTDVAVPKKNVLGGTVGAGWFQAMGAFDKSRPFIAAAAVGVARAAYEYAAQYAVDRVTFGKSLYKHQAISFMIADMATQIQAARHLVRHSAWLHDLGRPNTMEAAMAKRFAADVCNEVTTNAIQVYGGNGYSKEQPVEKLFRDAKIFQIYEGTSQIQRIIIGRELFKKLQ